MHFEKLHQIEQIYHAVLETPVGERSRFLEESCGADFALRAEIESLLSFEENSGNILDSSPQSLLEEVFTDLLYSNFIGKKINQYEILSLLGEGGMGTVFLAEDTKLERKVAVKFLADKFDGDLNILKRFFREAKSASALNHPNIITVYEIGEFENKPFITTEFIDGITLREFLTWKIPSIGEILDIALQICAALSTAHEAGIIHRDIKPDNVMIRRDGIVKVLDFGLAKPSRDYREIDLEARTKANISTVHGLILGTPQYMSPEQARGKKADARTDIWSFGVLFYQMLTRKLPFEGETTSDIIAAILKSEPPPLTRFVANIAPDLEKITLRALQKKPNDRYRNIDQFADELKNFRRQPAFETKTVAFDVRDSRPLENEKITDGELTRLTAKDSGVRSNVSGSFVYQTVETAKTHPVSAALIAITLVSLLTAIAGGFSKIYQSAEQSASFEKMKLSKLTFDGTTNDVAAVSPDGKYLVYALRDEGKQALTLRQTATGSVVRLVAPAAVNYTGLTFSRDGNYVNYTVSANDSGTLFEIPALGGNPRKILAGIDGKARFFARRQTNRFCARQNFVADRRCERQCGENFRDFRAAGISPSGRMETRR